MQFSPEDSTPEIKGSKSAGSTQSKGYLESKLSTGGGHTKPSVQNPLGSLEPSSALGPTTGTQHEIFSHVANPVRSGMTWKLLFGVCLVVAVISTFTAWQSYPLVGSYTQQDRERPEIPTKDTKFKVEGLNTSMTVYVDSGGKLHVVEITTVQITYIPLQRIFTAYTVEWRFKEVGRFSSTHIKLEGSPVARYALNEITLRGIASEQVADEFEQFKMNLNRDFQTATAELWLDENGMLHKRARYNGGFEKPNTYIRN